uniref:Uncharacterized protein n=1 Tax=uncultured bacterium A1Q1_fos_1815 TaxID=1256553 RepID=L7VWG5_9BACT|nr:hypothetical protein [uncultured bacterium A1Q1_fos_1815]
MPIAYARAHEARRCRLIFQVRFVGIKPIGAMVSHHVMESFLRFDLMK